MDTWVDIRRRARECHEKALLGAGGDRRGRALVDAALAIDDLEVRHFEPGTTFDEGVLGALERAARLINIVTGLGDEEELVVTAHEIGHFQLHLDPTNEVTTGDVGLAGDRVEVGAAKVEGYSSRERKEVQADVFTGEFLCPSDWAREEFVVNGSRPSELAAQLGLPYRLVLHQVIRALLLPPVRPASPIPKQVNFELDESQNRAATWSDGPLLVDAGPGTGKTRTLIHRVKYLLDSGVRPSEILALTFSNKAAGEMRERIAALNQQAAIELWVGTFHAFGLELLTKWPSAIGRTEKVKVFDDTQSLGLLEQRLADLPLHYYQNLYEPAYGLVHIVKAISRCKDEIVSPQKYLQEAEAALAEATDEKEKERAEKAIEVGKVYRIYEDALKLADAIDFGDLVLHAAALVEQNEAVKQYIGGFKHVLVDEYQDVNFASAKLLRGIRAAGADVWVVADQRQSIYRFRGAEPSNVARFTEEFEGQREPLSTNYRSVASIVETFEHFTRSMGDGRSTRGTWTANRTDRGSVSRTVTPDTAAEAEAIRDKIESFRNAGVPYCDQVILARTHLTLARMTDMLEKLNVPLLYLGDLFERDEIRDLLSLLSLGAEFGGVGLVRVAQLPDYGTPRDDALAVIQLTRADGVSVFDKFERLSDIEGLSEAGLAGLTKLSAELDGLAHVSAWTMLTTWLFERSEYLRPLLSASDSSSQQKLVAIYHLLKVCSEQDLTGVMSRRRFLERIRRIEALNQDGAYRTIASEAADIDAVRVMTIHGSKGLEFGAVHFPALATRYTPTNRQGIRCPPPPTLPQLAMEKEHHDAEEECLFFVGLSRARDHLSLSRAERYTRQQSRPSKFLSSIPSRITERRFDGDGRSLSLPVLLNPPEPRDCYSWRELDLYQRCPARYRYEVIDGMVGSGDKSAYARFHGCVYRVIEWLHQEQSEGRTIDVTGAIEHLTEEWDNYGPSGHPFAEYYRRTADEMVTRMAGLVAMQSDQYTREEWTVALGSASVQLRPDRVLVSADGTVRVQRIRTGRESNSETTKPIYGLLRRGAEDRHAGAVVIVETFYLATGKAVPVSPERDQKHIQNYVNVIEAVEHGEFTPVPDSQKCPTCPFYFTCGA